MTIKGSDPMTFQINSYHHEAALLAYLSPEQAAQRTALDVEQQRRVTDAAPCPEPDCAAPVGTPCFPADPRSSHQRREIAYFDALLWDRLRQEREAS